MVIQLWLYPNPRRESLGPQARRPHPIADRVLPDEYSYHAEDNLSDSCKMRGIGYTLCFFHI